MFEQTNQTEAVDEAAANEASENVFDDYESEKTNEDPQYAEPTNEAGTESPENTNEGDANVSPEKHKVIYNGQEFELTVDELITNAQKGMNYDHVYEQLQNLKNSPALSVLERYAKRSGMNIEQYAQYLENLETQQRVNTITAEGVPEAMAKRLVELEDKERVREEKEQSNQEFIRKQREYGEFLKAFPDASINQIPEEVWNMTREGMGLVPAYAMYENKRMKTTIQQYEQNEKNKEKSVGSIKGDSSEANADAFLEGLLG